MRTEDAFLNGQVRVLQPSDGYRAATDPVFLAATIPAKSGESVLDVGCGVGTAALCLGARIEGVNVTGIELQEDYVKLAQENATLNKVSLDVVQANLQELPSDLRQQSFDHVMTNPPFFLDGAMTAPESSGKATAHVETVLLQDWISIGLRRLKSRGSFTIIHLTERLPELLAQMSLACGDIRVLPIAARTGRPAKRVIVQGVKGSKAPLQLLAPFVVHDGEEHRVDGDDYCEAAKNILRNGAGLVL
jgi:tRNA1(Val) A37 N6-methylase TrmN6